MCPNLCFQPKPPVRAWHMALALGWAMGNLTACSLQHWEAVGSSMSCICS